MLTELFKLNPISGGNFHEVEPTLTRVDQLLMELSGTEDEPANSVLVALLRNKFSRVNKLSALFAQSDLNPDLQASALLANIRRLCAEQREAKGKKPGKGGPGKGSPGPGADAGRGPGSQHGRGAAGKGTGCGNPTGSHPGAKGGPGGKKGKPGGKKGGKDSGRGGSGWH